MNTSNVWVEALVLASVGVFFLISNFCICKGFIWSFSSIVSTCASNNSTVSIIFSLSSSGSPDIKVCSREFDDKFFLHILATAPWMALIEKRSSVISGYSIALKMLNATYSLLTLMISSPTAASIKVLPMGKKGLPMFYICTTKSVGKMYTFNLSSRKNVWFVHLFQLHSGRLYFLQS